MSITDDTSSIQKYKVLKFGFVLGMTEKLFQYLQLPSILHELPFLFKSILQHFDPPHKILLQIFLTFPLPLKKGNLGLSGEKKIKLSLDQICFFKNSVKKEYLEDRTIRYRNISFAYLSQTM